MTSELSEALKRFFFPREEVIEYWYCLVDNFQYMSGDFYGMVERELTARQVPGLEISRVNLSEGGLLSDRREYLQLSRERLVFRVCAAPFGTSFFVSFRFVESPLGIKPLQLVIFLVGFALLVGLFVKLLGLILGVIAVFVVTAGSIYVMQNGPVLGFPNLDAMLMRTPVLGPLYELFLRRETHHRIDTRIMYYTIVNAVTEKLVEEITAAKGVKLVTHYGRKPPSGDLYQATTKRLDERDDTPQPTGS
jgi:hypothetical protein